ncbi:MAG: DUF669 domain-containing protein [Akkermansia sp.]|nr:DUF669 domain-containing protein [Akkermansia sp.]
MFKFKTRNSSNEQKMTAAGHVPAGIYAAAIVDVQERTSKSGNPMLVLTLDVDAGGGRSIEVAEYVSLTERTAWKVERWLAACGHVFDEGQEVTLEPRMLLGRKPMVLTYNEPGQKDSSKLYMRIMAALTLAEVKYKGPLKPDDLRQYGLNSDGTMAGDSSTQKATHTPKSKLAPATYDEDDDLGF